MKRSDLSGLDKKLDLILGKLKELEIRMSQTDDAIAKLQGDVSAENNVVNSAITLLNGLSAQLAAALAAAANAGATPAQLQALSDLATSIEGSSASLAQAVANNTAPPGQPTPTATATDTTSTAVSTATATDTSTNTNTNSPSP